MYALLASLRKRLFKILAVLLISFCPLTGFAGKTVVPDNIPGTIKVSAEDVINMINNIPNLIIIDSRMQNDRHHGYIEGSIGLSDVETDCDSLSKHIPKKSTPVTFYCNGIKCGRSVKAAKIALECGYNRLYWYRGGFQDWKEKGYPYMTH